MAENQKNSVKKSFWQRNLFLIIIFLILLGSGGGYLYKNELISLNLVSEPNPSIINEKNVIKDAPVIVDTNNKELQEKVDRLENLILELSESVENISQSPNVQSEPEQIILSNGETYSLILSINLIVNYIDQQQLRNKEVQKLQNQYLFFQEEKFEELLKLPDYTFLLKQLKLSEQNFIQNEFMKNDNFQWLKNIISNVFEINIAKSKSNPLASYINAISNRQYASAIVEYENLTKIQKDYFKNTYDLAQLYNLNKIFLENMI
tara:strand:- start:161 stop:949 length:789 start_codon:yes stop_codon:yes gene_type:complete